jgi:hypothetical protein
MKKILLGLTLLTAITVTNAQDEDKNFRFGLKGDLSFNWLNPEKKNELANNGVGIGYAWGLQLEFKVANNISVVSGLNLLSAAYKLDYSKGSASGTSQYVLKASQEFADLSNYTNGFNDTTSSLRLFELNSRSIRGNYINIPLSLKMKTNEIGYMTYFGEFGVNINVLTKGKVIEDNVGYIGLSSPDSVVLRANPVPSTNEDLNITKSMGLFNMGLRIGGGAEYNFSGSTSMFFALHYNHYFINALRTKDKFLQKEDVNKPGSFISAGQKAIPGAITLTVGILF